MTHYYIHNTIYETITWSYGDSLKSDHIPKYWM